MKRISLSLLTLIALILFVSCGKKDSTPTTPSTTSLQGLWYSYHYGGLIKHSTIEFKDHRTGIFTTPQSTGEDLRDEDFTYTFEDNLLTLTFKDNPKKKEQLKATLNIISKDLIIMHSSKVETLLSKSATLSEEVGMKYLSYIPKTVVGKWDIYVNHLRQGSIEFMSDNSYKISLSEENASGQRELTGTFTRSWNKLETMTSDREAQVTNLFEITKGIIIMPWFLDYNMTILTPIGYNYNEHKREMNQVIEKFQAIP